MCVHECVFPIPLLTSVGTRRAGSSSFKEQDAGTTLGTVYIFCVRVCVCACVCARVCVCLCRECNSEHVYIVNIVVSLSYLSKHAG